MKSRALVYFQGLTAGDASTRLATIRALLPPSDPRFEDDWLDYKGGIDVNNYLEYTRKTQAFQNLPQQGQKEWKTKLPEAWSKMIGEFANNEGGVIVWGIDARKKENALGNQVDAPDSEILLDDIEAAESALRVLDGTVTDPPLNGIEHVGIPVEKGSKRGFLISYIPEGRAKPYRSESAGKQFFLRMGDDGKTPSVSLLRMLFTSAKSVRVAVYIQYIKRASNSQHAWSIRIENKGPSTLKDLHFSISSTDIAFDSLNATAYQRQQHRLFFKHGEGGIHMIERFGFPFNTFGEPTKSKIRWNILLSVEDYFPMSGYIDSEFGKSEEYWTDLQIYEPS